MPLKNLLLLFCLFAFIAVARTQSLYHVQYKLPQETTAYNAFLVFSDDGTGILRLRYQQGDEDIVVEADAAEQIEPGENADSMQTLYNFINPRFIVGKRDDNISLPQIKFTVNPSSGFAEPSGIISSKNVGNAQQSDVNFSATHIPVAGLQKNFLLQFFSEDEDFYRSIFQPATRGLSPGEKKTSLHLLIVANTKEKIIGGSCALDKERTLQTFSGLTKYLGIRMIVDSVSGNNYSKKMVEDALKKLRPSPQDIVVFYYSGHGYRRAGAKSRYPFIDLRSKPSDDHVKQPLGMEEIYTVIKNKGARTTLVLSDCCNNDVASTNIIASRPLRTKSSGLQWSEENIRALFFSKTPISVLATSADSGEKASGNEKVGGFFSIFFFKGSMESYCSKLKSNPTWDVILATAKMQTIQKASRTYCDKPYTPANVCKQSPYYTIEIGRGR